MSELQGDAKLALLSAYSVVNCCSWRLWLSV